MPLEIKDTDKDIITFSDVDGYYKMIACIEGDNRDTSCIYIGIEDAIKIIKHLQEQFDL